MRRLLALALLLAGCVDEEYYVWSDVPGIDTCEEVLKSCEPLLEQDHELYEDCADFVRDRRGLVDRVPGLHRQLTNDVAFDRKNSCVDAMAYLAAWRTEE